MNLHILTYPAPRSASLPTDKGFYSLPWDVHTVVNARLAGCWFSKLVDHNFKNSDAKKVAFMSLEDIESALNDPQLTQQGDS